MKKKNPPSLTARNLNPLKRRITKLEQANILLKGDINKTNRLMNELRVLVDRALQWRP